MNFEELGLDKNCAQRLVTHGIMSPTSIQKEVFPLIREGKSVVALSKTGTGKTMAYLAPLVQRYTYDLSEGDLSSKTWGLILVPTRELADQVSKNLNLLGEVSLNSVVIVGGESERRQITEGQKAHLIVATPGRFLDLLQRDLVSVQELKSVVFDEADRILDMGFIDDVRAIRRLLPNKLQMCFFSATLHFGVEEMAYEFGVEAERIGKEADEITVEGLDHRVAFVGDNEKFHALAHFLYQRKNERGIVFTNYRERAHELVYRLRGLGYRAESLTAQLNQSQRSRSMQDFREGKTHILVASDLASRGLDIAALDFVLNFDLPDDPATYVHRVGRTARAGKQGIALSLVGFEDTYRLERLEKFLGKEVLRFQFETENLSGPLPSLKPLQNSSAPTQRSPRAKEARVRSEAPKPVSTKISTANNVTKTEIRRTWYSSAIDKIFKFFGIGAKATVNHSSRQIADRGKAYNPRPSHHGNSEGSAGRGRRYAPRNSRPRTQGQYRGKKRGQGSQRD